MQSNLEALERLKLDSIEQVNVKSFDIFCPAMEDKIKRIIINSCDMRIRSDSDLYREVVHRCFIYSYY